MSALIQGLELMETVTEYVNSCKATKLLDSVHKAILEWKNRTTTGLSNEARHSPAYQRQRPPANKVSSSAALHVSRYQLLEGYMSWVGPGCVNKGSTLAVLHAIARLWAANVGAVWLRYSNKGADSVPISQSTQEVPGKQDVTAQLLTLHKITCMFIVSACSEIHTVGMAACMRYMWLAFVLRSTGGCRQDTAVMFFSVWCVLCGCGGAVIKGRQWQWNKVEYWKCWSKTSSGLFMDLWIKFICIWSVFSAQLCVSPFVFVTLFFFSPTQALTAELCNLHIMSHTISAQVNDSYRLANLTKGSLPCKMCLLVVDSNGSTTEVICAAIGDDSDHQRTE